MTLIHLNTTSLQYSYNIPFIAADSILKTQSDISNFGSTYISSTNSVCSQSQSIFKCPTEEISCSHDNLQSSLNYFCRPGFHSVKSVVVGTRACERNAIQQKMKTENLLKKFEDALYQPENLKLVPIECKKISDEFANEIFARYLDKYRHCGLNEKNAIEWSYGDFKKGFIDVSKLENQWNTWRIQAVVELNGQLNEDKYLPPGITAYHELMHVEETPKLHQNEESETGYELLTTLTTVMQLDEVFKKCKNVDLSVEVDYQKALKVQAVSIPIGKVANCYRSLAKHFNSLVDATLSTASINFLKTGTCKVI